MHRVKVRMFAARGQCGVWGQMRAWGEMRARAG